MNNVTDKMIEDLRASFNNGTRRAVTAEEAKDLISAADLILSEYAPDSVPGLLALSLKKVCGTFLASLPTVTA